MPSMFHKKSNLSYLHLQKTGGWHVSHILKQLGFQNINFNICGGHVGVKDAPKNSFTFGFVRHPVAWYKSLFNYFSNVNWIHRAHILKTDNINEFIELTQKHRVYQYEHLVTRFYNLNADDECNFIGRYELLHHDLKRVLYLHAQQLDVECSHIDQIIRTNQDKLINKSITIHNDQFSEDSIQYIYESCKQIIDRFKYDI